MAKSRASGNERGRRMSPWEWLYGVSPVQEALRHQHRTFRQLLLKQPVSERLQEIQQQAEKLSIPVHLAERGKLDEICPEGVHQGVLLEATPREMLSPQPFPSPTGNPIYLVLDQIADPQNFGAILRSCAFFGASGCIVARDHSCGITPTVSKTSVGVVEWFPVYAATNLKRFLDNRKEEGFWVVGMDGSAQSDLRDLQADRPLMLVLGNEGKGVRPLVLSACDWTVKISGTNQVESLNVSSAAALALYQVSSQAL